MPSISNAAPPPSPLWDIFCRVVDNYGDVGVCWRLACNLAERGQRVRLWVDDATALRWMAPDGHDGVAVAAWGAGTSFPPPGDVVVEAFGCDPAPAFVAAMAAAGEAARPPVWINLEYLSAERYVERSHALASPQMSGPARGLTKWFFYPGFTPATGGLLREPALPAEQAVFDRAAWLAARGMTLTQLSEQVGVTIVNLSILKNGRARAIRFSTLTRLCEALDCQPGDLLRWEAEDAAGG